MRNLPIEFSLANLQSSFGGIPSDGLTGSAYNVSSNQSKATVSVIGKGASSNAGGGGGGYAGGGQGPGSGSAGAGADSPGGMNGTASSGYPGGQDPGNLPSTNPPPADQDDPYDQTANYNDISGLGGTGNCLLLDVMPHSPAPVAADEQPQPLPGALLGSDSCSCSCS